LLLIILRRAHDRILPCRIERPCPAGFEEGVVHIAQTTLRKVETVGLTL